MTKEKMQETYDKDYFKEAILYWRKHMHRFHHKNYTSMLTIWTHVRCLVYSYYGVHALTQMKPEWKDEANKRAIDILKLVEKAPTFKTIDVWLDQKGRKYINE